MRLRRREVAIKQETTPGTAETVTSSDVLARIREDDSFEADFQRWESGEVQAYSSARPGLSGRKMLAFPLSCVLRGSGSVGTAPAISPMLEAAMLLESTLKSIGIGAVTTGPFEDGETITGTNSSATGRVFRDTADGASVIRYVPISGTMQDAETITGGTSGATATTSSAPTDAGLIYEPTDSDFGGSDSKHHVTVKYNLDGLYLTARGCLADLEMRFQNGNPAIISQRFVGAYSAHGDDALWGLTAFPEDTVTPPRFSNVQMKIGAYSPSDIIEAVLRVPTNPEPREDANDTAGDGVKYADYAKDYPTVTLEPAMVKAATYDYFQELADGDTFAMEWVLGSTAGSIWTFYADEAQLITVGSGDRRNLAVAPIEIGLFGTRNNEFVIWHH